MVNPSVNGSRLIIYWLDVLEWDGLPCMYFSILPFLCLIDLLWTCLKVVL